MENHIPKVVENHIKQINSTIKLLKDSGLTEITIRPDLSYARVEKTSKISWNNSNLNESINSSTFTSLKDYVTIYNNKTFQIMLFDYSLIRCSMEFKGDLLLRQNFSWIPCPISIFKKDNNGKIALRGQFEMESIFYDEIAFFDDMYLRTPVRVDFDTDNDTPTHPKSHIHFQNPFTRLNTEDPVCFNTFMKFILSSCYPEEYLQKKIIPLIPKIDLIIKDDNLKGLKINHNCIKKVEYIDDIVMDFGNIRY